MVRIKKILLFLIVWTILHSLLPYILFLLSFLFYVLFSLIKFPEFIRDFKFYIIDFRIVENLSLIPLGIALGVFQVIPLKILISNRIFLNKWILFTGLGTYIGRVLTEVFGKLLMLKEIGLDDGSEGYRFEYEPYINLPVLSFFQGIVLSTHPELSKFAGIFWWVFNSVRSIALGLMGVKNQTYLIPTLEYILTSGILIAVIVHFSQKRLVNSEGMNNK
jgi:hypothetical protein